MSNPIIIETDLKDILAKLDNRLERIETKLEVGFDSHCYRCNCCSNYQIRFFD